MVNLTNNLASRRSLLAARETEHPGLAGLLIDMQSTYTKKMYVYDQDDYFDHDVSYDEYHDTKDFSAHDKDSIIRSQIEAIRYFAKTNIPIINILYESGRTIKELRKELYKVPTVISFEKSGYNAFNSGRKYFFESYKDGYLKKILLDMNIKDIFVMGIYASNCAYDTALGGIRAGFNVFTADTVIADAKGLLDSWTDKRRAEYEKDGVKYFNTHSDFIKSLKKK